METVLVTGGTGLIGMEVVRLLCEQGLRPRVLVRRPRRGALLHGLDVEPVQGDLTRPASLRRAVEGVDTVLHLAARATMEPLDVLRPTIVDGTRDLATAAADAGVRHVLYASSLLAHGAATTAHPIDATTAPDPQVDYGRAKVLAEGVLRDVEARGGPSVGIVRLPHVYGPGDLLFSRVRRGLLVTPGLGRNPYAHLHVLDAARLLVAAAGAGWDGTSATADDVPATWKRFFATVEEHDARFTHVAVPAPLARAGAHVAARLDRRPGPSMITPDTVTGWNLAQPVAAGLVWDDLDLRPTYASIEQGIPAVLDASILFRWRHPVDDRRR